MERLRTESIPITVDIEGLPHIGSMEPANKVRIIGTSLLRADVFLANVVSAFQGSAATFRGRTLPETRDKC
jgi:hypothetical protein